MNDAVKVYVILDTRLEKLCVEVILGELRKRREAVCDNDVEYKSSWQAPTNVIETTPSQLTVPTEIHSINVRITKQTAGTVFVFMEWGRQAGVASKQTLLGNLFNFCGENSDCKDNNDI